MTLITQSERPDIDPIKVINKCVRLIQREWQTAAILFSAITFGVYLALLFTSNQYDSAAQVLVKLGRENTQTPVTVEKGNIFSSGIIQKEEIYSYMRLMTSNEIINKTIEELGTDRFTKDQSNPETVFAWVKFAVKSCVRWGKNRVDDVLILLGLRNRLSDHDKAFKLLKDNLHTVREKDSNVISIFIRLKDPYLARDIIAKVLDLYSKYHVELNNREKIVDIFKGQTNSDKSALAEIEKKIETLKQTKGLSLPDLQIQTLVQNIQKLKSNKDLELIRRAELLEKKRELQSQFNSLPKMQVTAELKEINPTAALVKTELGKLKVKQARMLKSYQPDSEVVKEITARVADMEALLASENSLDSMGTTTSQNPLSQDVYRQIKNIDVVIKGLDASIPKTKSGIRLIEKEIEEIRKGKIELQALEREFSVLESKYLANASRYERVKTERMLDDNKVANISVLSKASLATQPAAPKRLLLMIIGSIFALILSLGFILVKDWFKQTIYDEEDITEMPDIKFLGTYSIPK